MGIDRPSSRPAAIPQIRIWCAAITDAVVQPRWLEALAAAGVFAYRIGSRTADAAEGPGLVFVDGPSRELTHFVRAASRNGTERVLVVGSSRDAIQSADGWSLLRSGAADVCWWDGAAAAACSQIAQRFERWERVDTIVRSSRVREMVVGVSTAWLAALRRAVETALFTDAPALIEGETGTGKDCVARLIHDLDTRHHKGSLVLLDCTTVVPDLAGSEFFGHERGAFTGAVSTRDGAFAIADGGTLFLDEVGELPRPLQAELLRVVQEGSYKRVGGNQWRPSRFRLISATNRDLVAEVHAGAFRQDLYYRLASVRLTLPPLRQRPDDILPLVRHFFQQLRPECDPPELDDAVAELLIAREYPGNVRDLRQLVTRIAYRHTGHGPITPGHVPEEDRPTKAEAYEWRDASFDAAIARAVALRVPLREIGQATSTTAIRLALTQEGSLHGAARRLGVTDRALQIRRQKQRQTGPAILDLRIDPSLPVADLPSL